jgi:transposase InsO family protein
MEIIRIVEGSVLSVRKTLEELDVNRSSFYSWYNNYLKYGFDGLINNKKGPKQFWNKIPLNEKEKIRKIALEMPEKSPRELAWHITDNEGYYISESSVYRILKSYDLITSPAYILISAAERFKHPTKCVNELWQTDFTYFKIKGWGFYYMASILDDYSRYIISWKLFTTMQAGDVQEVLDMALEATGLNRARVNLKPRLLTDNGPCYVSEELRSFLDKKGMEHTRGATFHPQTQGKIERFHRSMKNQILLDNYYLPGELERAIANFIDYYNNHRYHEGINNQKPVDVFNGRSRQIETFRSRIKKETLMLRKLQNLNCFYHYN